MERANYVCTKRASWRQITSEMRRYGLHILGVSESRWTGSGRLRTTAGETVLYSGTADDQHHDRLREQSLIFLRDSRVGELAHEREISLRKMRDYS